MLNNNFKQTSIGKIPKEWGVVKLEGLVRVDSGNTAPQEKKYFKDGKYSFIRMKHLNNLEENKYCKNFDLINNEAIKNKKFKLFKKGTILLAKSGESIRSEKKALLNFDSFIVNHLATLVVKDNDKMDNNFLFYFFKKFKLSNLIMQTTTPSINLSTFKKIKIPLPSLSEQQKIAQVLSTVDEGIQKVDEVIEKTERLKKGLMKKLFTEGIGHKEFKKTKIGKIPKDWKVSKLGEDTNFKMIMGQSPPSSSYNSNKEGYPFLQGNADFGDIYPALYIYTKKPIKIAQKGDILISVRAPVGDINLSPQKICIGRGLSAIRVLEGDNFFYFYWLTKNKNRLKNKSTGSTFKAITKNELNNLTIPIVPFPEQQKIAQILSTVDKKIQLQKKRKERFIRIKKSLMNDLLTGRKRVGVEH